MRLLIIGSISRDVTSAIDIAKKRHAKVMMVENIENALGFLREGKGADLVLVDVKLDIACLVRSLESERILIPIVAYGIACDAKEAVSAIKAGAKEFLPLPPDEHLIAAILSAISVDKKQIIASSPLMLKVLNTANKIAKSDANVLITGRSGTGKEVIANHIHQNSDRANQPFVRVNCAAIPENLLESELFGHEKGSFTGAIARRIGKFEESSGGTLLLDEISEIDVKLQAKLLRAIQEQEVDRIGGSSPIKLNLRVIATSNRNLQHEIDKGNFREDLYFRLNIIKIELPDLKDRKEDIISLAEYFVKKYCDNNKLAQKKLLCIDKLCTHNWPGNVRELENVIHRAVLLSEGIEIQDNDINFDTATDAFQQKTIADVEKKLIKDTLNYCLGDLNHAANILGVSINILQEKLKMYTL